MFDIPPHKDYMSKALGLSFRNKLEKASFYRKYINNSFHLLGIQLKKNGREERT